MTCGLFNSGSADCTGADSTDPPKSDSPPPPDVLVFTIPPYQSTFYYSPLFFSISFFLRNNRPFDYTEGFSSHLFCRNLNSIHINLSLILKRCTTNHILTKETVKQGDWWNSKSWFLCKFWPLLKLESWVIGSWGWWTGDPRQLSLASWPSVLISENQWSHQLMLSGSHTSPMEKKIDWTHLCKPGAGTALQHQARECCHKRMRVTLCTLQPVMGEQWGTSQDEREKWCEPLLDAKAEC